MINQKQFHYVLNKSNSTDCNKLYENEQKIKVNLNTINNFTDFETQCLMILNNIETYNKKELENKLMLLYLEGKKSNNYTFELKTNTIKDIIKSWKKNSIKFTKYNALENNLDDNGELI